MTTETKTRSAEVKSNAACSAAYHLRNLSENDRVNLAYGQITRTVMHEANRRCESYRDYKNRKDRPVQFVQRFGHSTYLEMWVADELSDMLAAARETIRHV